MLAFYELLNHSYNPKQERQTLSVGSSSKETQRAYSFTLLIFIEYPETAGASGGLVNKRYGS